MIDSFVIPASIYLLLFSIIYVVLLKPLKAASIKRYYLLSVIPLSLLFCLVKIETLTVNNTLYTLNTFTVGSLTEVVNTTTVNVLFLAYLIGSMFMAIKYALAYRHLKNITKSAHKITTQSHDYWFTPSIAHVFSFGNKIYAGKKLLPTAILIHEQEHIKQLHHADKGFFIICKVIFWFHPMIYFLAKWSEENNEILADSPLASIPSKKEAYISLLKQEALEKLFPEWALPFSKTSQLKNRIKMMYKTEQNKKAKFASLFVVVGLLFLAPIINSSCSKEAGKKEIDNVSPTEEPYTTVETMPEFNGGNKALFAYLGENIKYPKNAESENKEGMVYVSFVIDKNGKVKDTKVVKGFDTACENEALRVLEAMPDWTPGVQAGQTVDVQLTLPVRFQLN